MAATGGDTQQLITLHKTLMKHAEDGGTELDSGNPAQWIDTDRRLGNTGAATWFVQMAIAVMGSYRDGGVSAAVNLRNPQEASIVLISPPSEEKRRTQKHPNGGDVFAHHGTPAIIRPIIRRIKLQIPSIEAVFAERSPNAPGE